MEVERLGHCKRRRVGREPFGHLRNIAPELNLCSWTGGDQALSLAVDVASDAQWSSIGHLTQEECIATIGKLFFDWQRFLFYETLILADHPFHNQLTRVDRLQAGEVGKLFDC